VDNAYLYVTNATGDQTDFVTIELSEGVMITSVSTGGSGGDERLTENVTLHFGKFKYSFQPQDDKGKAQGGTKDFTFNMQQVLKS
jgi:type VI secretion system secreted protein Hcp